MDRCQWARRQLPRTQPFSSSPFPFPRRLATAVHQAWSPGHHARPRTPGSPAAASNKPDQTNDSFLRARPSPQPSVSRRPFCGNVLRSSRRLLPSFPRHLLSLPHHRSSLFIPHRRSDAKLLLFLRLPLVPPGSVSPGVEDPAFSAASACGGCWLFLGSCTTGKRGRRAGGEGEGLVGLRWRWRRDGLRQQREPPVV